MRPTILVLFLLLSACQADAEPSPDPVGQDHGAMSGVEFVAAPAAASLSFGEPADGATVASPVKVVMQAAGIKVRPAGEVLAGTGHHHVIVDGEPVPARQVVPKDETHIHFGDGSSETTLELTPGQHTLTLQFADGMHRSYGEGLSRTISVTVE